MSIKIFSQVPLIGNAAAFENIATGDKRGAIAWDEPVLEGNVYKVTFSGFDVTGKIIPVTTIEVEATSEPINPTKVFWWIAEKAKGLLCPKCT